jgi:hypothetical protein
MSQAGQFMKGGSPAVVETLTGNTGGPVGPTGNNINVVGDGTTVTVAGNPGTSTLTISALGSVATTYDEDSGSATPVANILHVIGGESVAGEAINMNTIGSGNTIKVCLNNSISQPDTNSSGTTGMYSLGGQTFMHNFGFNTFLGRSAGNLTVTGTFNVGIGPDSGLSLTSGSGNYFIGGGPLVTSGSENVAIGSACLAGASSATGNVAIGQSSSQSLGTGTNNVSIGITSGSNWNAAESNNIAILNNGVVGDSGIIRIGTDVNQTSCFIAGIQGVNVGSVASVVSISGDQLGTTTITAGTGVTITPGANTITIAATGTTSLNFRSVSTTPYVVAATDDFLGVTTTSLAITVQLPNAPATGRVYSIKDSTGNASAHNITVTTVGGTVLIDGTATFLMNTAYQAISVIFDGTNYEIF